VGVADRGAGATGARLGAELTADGSDTAGCGATGDNSETVAQTPGSTATNPSPADTLTPLLGSVSFAPVPFAGSDGKTHVVYELAVTNFAGAVTVDDVKIEDSQSGRVLGDLDATQLKDRLQPAGSRESADHLAPGKNEVTERLAATNVDTRTLPVLSAPLRGERFLAADGQTYLAQRYAIAYGQTRSTGSLPATPMIRPVTRSSVRRCWRSRTARWSAPATTCRSRHRVTVRLVGHC
jgi:hypothetical protein